MKIHPLALSLLALVANQASGFTLSLAGLRPSTQLHGGKFFESIHRIWPRRLSLRCRQIIIPTSIYTFAVSYLAKYTLLNSNTSKSHSLLFSFLVFNRRLTLPVPIVSKRAVKKANKELQQLSAPLDRPGDKPSKDENEGTSKVLVNEDTGLR